jgi:hypothetical protein
MTGLRFLLRVTMRRLDLAAEIFHMKEPVINREMPQEAGTIGKVQEVPCRSVGVICRENRWLLGRKTATSTRTMCVR